MYRIPGCGIVPTLGFFTAYHLGVSELITVGVDLTLDGYFDSDEKNYRNEFNKKEISLSAQSMPAWRKWLATRGVKFSRLESRTATNLPEIPISVVPPELFEE